jgi:hypothetical protein
MTISDDGPQVQEHPSKLWSSREEFQDVRAPNIPTGSFGPLASPQSLEERLNTATVTFESVQTVLSMPRKATTPPNLPRPDVLNIPQFSQYDVHALSIIRSLQKQGADIITAFESFPDGKTLSESHDYIKASRKWAIHAEQNAARITRKSKDVLTEKESLLTLVDLVDCRISTLERMIPPDTRPVEVNTGQSFIFITFLFLVDESVV